MNTQHAPKRTERRRPRAFGGNHGRRDCIPVSDRTALARSKQFGATVDCLITGVDVLINGSVSLTILTPRGDQGVLVLDSWRWLAELPHDWRTRE